MATFKSEYLYSSLAAFLIEYYPRPFVIQVWIDNCLKLSFYTVLTWRIFKASISHWPLLMHI